MLGLRNDHASFAIKLRICANLSGADKKLYQYQFRLGAYLVAILKKQETANC